MLASSAAWLLALLLAFNLRPFRPRCRSMWGTASASRFSLL